MEEARLIADLEMEMSRFFIITLSMTWMYPFVHSKLGRITLASRFSHCRAMYESPLSSTFTNLNPGLPLSMDTCPLAVVSSTNCSAVSDSPIFKCRSKMDWVFKENQERGRYLRLATEK